jgi:hypothetical protein
MVFRIFVGPGSEHDADVRFGHHHRLLGRRFAVDRPHRVERDLAAPRGTRLISTAWNATFTFSALLLSWLAIGAMFILL